MIREATGKKIFAIQITDKGPMSRKYQDLPHITKKDRQSNRKIGKRPEQTNRYPNDWLPSKKCSISGVIGAMQTHLRPPEWQKYKRPTVPSAGEDLDLQPSWEHELAIATVQNHSAESTKAESAHALQPPRPAPLPGACRAEVCTLNAHPSSITCDRPGSKSTQVTGRRWM